MFAFEEPAKFCSDAVLAVLEPESSDGFVFALGLLEPAVEAESACWQPSASDLSCWVDSVELPIENFGVRLLRSLFRFLACHNHLLRLIFDQWTSRDNQFVYLEWSWVPALRATLGPLLGRSRVFPLPMV